MKCATCIFYFQTKPGAGKCHRLPGQYDRAGLSYDWPQVRGSDSCPGYQEAPRVEYLRAAQR